MDASLDERYLIWLYSQVASVKTRTRTRTHWGLLTQLHETEFIGWLPNDDNRASDGIDLRGEFVDEDRGMDTRAAFDIFFTVECSMLEMLIALSRRISFESSTDAPAWFWHMMDVLGLKQFNDAHYNIRAETAITRKIDKVIWRKYSPNGRGGLFPLRHADEDQTKVELWYQFNAYLLEQM